MSLAFAPSSSSPDPASRIAFLEGENKRLRRERDEARAEIKRLEEERSSFFMVLSNGALQPAERIVSLFTLFEVESETKRGQKAGEYVPICAKAIATRAGVSSDTASKAIDRLAKFDAWKKAPRDQCRPQYDAIKEQWSTPLILQTPGALLENLRTVARLAPSSDERKALTGSSKPGSQPGEKRERIDRTCPECGSSNTCLQCLDCGAITNTSDLLPTEKPDDGREPQLTDTPGDDTTPPHPQLAALKDVLHEPVTCGYPPENTQKDGHPSVCSLLEPAPIAKETTWLPLIPGNVPQELLSLHWMISVPEPRPNGGFNKAPRSPHTGMKASKTNSDDWGTFGDAWDAMKRSQAPLAGVVLREDDEMVLIDIDKCRDPETGELSDWARARMAMLPTYWEASPSGTGIRGVMRGKKPTGSGTRWKIDGHEIEVYDAGAFLTITGHRLQGASARVMDCTDALAELYSQCGRPPAPSMPLPLAPTPTCDDAELMERALNAKNGAKFEEFCRGGNLGLKSDSDGDIQTLLYLAYWTGADGARMERMIRGQTARYREKWDELGHYPARPGVTWLQGQIDWVLRNRWNQ